MSNVHGTSTGTISRSTNRPTRCTQNFFFGAQCSNDLPLLTYSTLLPADARPPRFQVVPRVNDLSLVGYRQLASTSSLPLVVAEP
jgi:hypothetical protein